MTDEEQKAKEKGAVLEAQRAAEAKLLTEETVGLLERAKKVVPGYANSAVAILYGAKAICLELAALRKTLAVRSGDPFRPRE